VPTIVTTDHPLNITSSDPAWKAFEKEVANLTAAVHATPSSVTWDAKLPGIDSKVHRQVDVHVQGEINGVPIEIAIECKRYGRPIDVGEMEAFKGKLFDLSVDAGVFYVHDGVTQAARNIAAAARHPKIVLKEFAGASLLGPAWSTSLEELLDWDCPNDNCFGGYIGWSGFRQPAGGADVEAGYCEMCGTFAIRCRECGEVDSADYGTATCYTCGATYDVTTDRKGSEVEAVVQLTRGED